MHYPLKLFLVEIHSIRNQLEYLGGGAKAKEMLDSEKWRQKTQDKPGRQRLILNSPEFISQPAYILIIGKRQKKELYSQLTTSLHCPWEDAPAGAFSQYKNSDSSKQLPVTKEGCFRLAYASPNLNR